MGNIIKKAYCFYVVQLLLSCNSENDLNNILDRVIDEETFERFVEGDNDIKTIFEYVYRFRLYSRSIVNERPCISSKTVARVLAKSVF